MELAIPEPVDDLHLSPPQDEIAHQEVEEVVPGTPKEPSQNGARRTAILLSPQVSLLELPGAHQLGLEDHMTHIVVRPMVIEDPPLLLKSFPQRGPGKGREDGESRKLDMSFVDEIDGSPKHVLVIVVEPKDEGALNPYPVVLNSFYEVDQLVRVHKGLSRPVQVLLIEGLETDEKGDAAAFSGKGEQFRISGDLKGTKSHPLDLIFLKDLKEFGGEFRLSNNVIIGEKQVFPLSLDDRGELGVDLGD
jgi:hypothetical protein